MFICSPFSTLSLRALPRLLTKLGFGVVGVVSPRQQPQDQEKAPPRRTPVRWGGVGVGQKAWLFILETAMYPDVRGATRF